MIMKHHLTALVLAGAFRRYSGKRRLRLSDQARQVSGRHRGLEGRNDRRQEAGRAVQHRHDRLPHLLDSEFNAEVAALPSATTEKEKAEVEKKKAALQKKQDEKHDAAVNELTAVTDGFNEQLRAYKAKNNPPEKKTS